MSHIISQLAAIRRDDLLREAVQRRLAKERTPEDRSPRARVRRWFASYGCDSFITVNRRTRTSTSGES